MRIIIIIMKIINNYNSNTYKERKRMITIIIRKIIDARITIALSTE